MRTSAKISALILASCLGSGAALGADRGRGEIGLDAGYADLADEQGGGGPLFALRGGYHLTRWFEVEGELARLLPDCPRDECSDLWTGLINLVFNWNATSIFVPYALLGAGYTDFDEEPEIVILEDQFEGQVVYKVAAGARIFFGSDSRMAMRVEVSQSFFEDYDSPNAQAGVLWRLGSGQ